MKKTILILIIIISILIICIGLFVYFIVQKSRGVPIVVNKNVPIETEAEKAQKTISDPALHLAEIRKEKLTYPMYYSLLSFYSFCDTKDNDKSPFEECDNVINKHLWGDANKFYCYKNVNFIASLYFIKSGLKEKYINLCEASKTLTEPVSTLPKEYLDCNLRWETKIFEDKGFCDDSGEGCPLLITDERKSTCQNKIDLKTVDISQLKDLKCKEEIPFRKASSKDDCMKIEDDLTRLTCLELYEKQACNDIKQAVDLLKLPDFIEKYQLKNCCYNEADYEGSALP
jgi:hypothetical protein